jgi:ABC-2 type transport system ATP-binding protein
MPAPPALRVHDVHKRFRLYHERPSSLKERVVRFRRAHYDVFSALKGVSCEVEEGETFGLIGPNGSGKSTLLKIIAGVFRPDSGTVETRGRLVSLLELGAGFHPDLTGRENVYLNASILGLTRRDTDRHFDAIVMFAELEPFIDMQVKHYSSGMYVRLGFSVAAHLDPELLIVDEVLAVGDEHFQRKCLARIGRLQANGCTIIFVTHSLDLVRQICTRAAFLDQGEVVCMGRPDEVVAAFRRVIHAVEESEAPEERGDRRVRVKRVDVTGGDGEPKEVFSPGDRLGLSVFAESDEQIDDWSVGIAIYDERGTLVFGTNTEIEAKRLDPIHGASRVRFVIPSVPFGEGDYRVEVGLTSRSERQVYHWQERSAGFRCRVVDLQQGILRLPVEVDVEAPDLHDLGRPEAAS